MVERLGAYHFHEQAWDSYDDLRAAFEWEVPGQFNMADYVCERWAEETPEAVALYAETAGGRERTLTYGDLGEYTDRLANYLAAEGVGRGDRVGVNVGQKPETVLAHVACWKLGAVSIPLSTLFGVDGLSYRLDDADAVVCVVDAANVDTLRDVRGGLDALETVLTVDVGDPQAEETDLWAAIESAGAGRTVAETDAEDDGLLIYTSGTTGDPKGVRHAHRVLLGHLPLFLTTFCNLEMTDDDVYWTPAEWAWIASLFDVVMPGLYYGQSVLAYAGGEFDPEEAYRLLEKYEVTNFFAPPTGLRMMARVDQPGHDVSSVRVVPSGGESLGLDIVNWAGDVFEGAAVHEGYGQTEANMLVGHCTALSEFREGKMGLAGPGHEVTVVDPETAEPTVDRGEVGELAVRYEGNPVCFKQYLGKPEQTDAKVRNGWLLTEDLGTVDEDDYFSFKSRKDDVIISAGYRIGPEEVEEHLADHEAVADAGVVGVPDDERGQVPKAFVVTQGVPADGLREELQSHVRNRLAAYEYPREVEFVDELPKTATGKVRREDLREGS